MGRDKKSNPPSTNSSNKEKGIKWLWGAVDLLASEYGWTKDYIFKEIYFDEFYYLKKEINQRQKRKMIEAIGVQHGDPKKMIESLKETATTYEKHAKLDKASFNQLKTTLTDRGGFVIK